MKTIVLDREFLDVDIRPGAESVEYRRRVEDEIRRRFTGSVLVGTPCPGCLSDASRDAFVKLGLSYRECSRCGTLFVSPRPTDAALTEFYRTSEALAFWRDRVLTPTREMRRTKVFAPRARWVLDTLDQYRRAARSIVLVGYHNDVLVEEIARQEPAHPPLIVTNPVADIEFAAAPGERVTVRPMPIGEVASVGSTDAMLAFDFIDRCVDVDAFFAAARRLLPPGGLLLGTATLASGFDVQALWDRAPVVVPPDRLNVFSIDGLSSLVERHGFETLEFSTPGVLDAEIVQRAIHQDPGGEWPRAVRQLLDRATPAALSAFQEHLQQFRLSSFGRFVLRVPA
jgi:hypothetical protein